MIMLMMDALPISREVGRGHAKKIQPSIRQIIKRLPIYLRVDIFPCQFRDNLKRFE